MLDLIHSLRGALADAQHLFHPRALGDHVVEHERVLRLLLEARHFAGEHAQLQGVLEERRRPSGRDDVSVVHTVHDHLARKHGHHRSFDFWIV